MIKPQNRPGLQPLRVRRHARDWPNGFRGKARCSSDDQRSGPFPNFSIQAFFPEPGRPKSSGGSMESLSVSETRPDRVMTQGAPLQSILNNDGHDSRGDLPLFAFGQFWVMRCGESSKSGSAGNQESITCTLESRPKGSNPTLTARIETIS